MPTFLYRCPNTGKNVQGWIADDAATFSEDSYKALTCIACTRIHLVNPKTGRSISDNARK